MAQMARLLNEVLGGEVHVYIEYQLPIIHRAPTTILLTFLSTLHYFTDVVGITDKLLPTHKGKRLQPCWWPQRVLEAAARACKGSADDIQQKMYWLIQVIGLLVLIFPL